MKCLRQKVLYNLNNITRFILFGLITFFLLLTIFISYIFLAKEIFSNLKNNEFKFYDEKKALLSGEFLIEHIQFSGRGAIIIIEVDEPVVQGKFFIFMLNISYAYV